MSALYPTDLFSYLGILLVFLRLLGFFILVPGFSHRAIPMNVKMCLALALAFSLYGIVKPDLDMVTSSLGSFVGAALRETAVGFLMGFGAYVTFEGINLGAQLVGYQMGFGTVSLMDPQNQSQVSIMVALQGWLALMVFFVSDMHYELINVFISSFHVTHALADVPWDGGALAKAVMLITGKLFVLAIQIAAPFTLVMLLCNVAIGVLSRMMPQMNVMLFSFPVTILLGLSALYLFAPELLVYLESVLGDMSSDLMNLLKSV